MKKLFMFPLCLIATSLFMFSGCELEENNQKPTCTITNPKSGAKIPKGATISISVEAEDEDGNISEVRFYIDNSGVASVENFPFSYKWKTDDISPGDHTIKVEAIDEEGAMAEDEIKVSIGDSPEAAFAADSAAIHVDGEVNFTDESTGEPTEWQWDFGDGETSSEANPSHTYSSVGTYTVELTVSNDYGSDTETKTDYITVSSTPVADFSADQTDIAEGDSVQFTDESSNYPTDWSWNFGDGNTSSEANPSHTYSSVGTYTVELTVSNDYGSDTKTKTDYITVENTFTDSRDGQTYELVRIGDQVWMAENLNYDQDSYGNDWCYDDDPSNCDTYGRLYDWEAFMQGESSSDQNPSGVQGVCPDGWHVPSDGEWKELEMELGMSQSEADDDGWRGTNEGSKLAGNASLWYDGELEDNPEFDATGFKALPGGRLLYSDGSFDGIGRAGGRFGCWWSSTRGTSTTAWNRLLGYSYTSVKRNLISQDDGFSVRCVRD